LSIRKRLLTLAIGGVVPLLVVGLALLWSVWNAKEQQLNEGIEQQAQLAAVLFNRWLDAQGQPLRTVAEYSNQNRTDANQLQDALEAAMAPRPSWTDMRVLDAEGRVVAIQPTNAESLPEGLAERALAEAQRGGSVVETDWTKGEGRYSLVFTAPMKSRGVVIARIDGSSLKEIFQEVTLPDRTVVMVMDPQRRIIYRSQRSESSVGVDLTGSTIASVLNDRNTAVVVLKSSVDNVERVYGVARAGRTGYSLSVGVPSSILYARAWRQISVYALLSLLIALCTVAAALLIARSIGRPVRLLSLAAQQFGEGDFAARAPSGGEDEMSRLGMNFNAMAQRLEQREARLAELDTLKSEWVSRVSHELRTPLTTIKALTRLLMRDGLSEAKQREYIETISVECDRQIDLVLNLLDLARIEGGVFRITHERVDVDEVMLSCVKAGIRAADKRGHILRVDKNRDRLFVCADPKTIRRVLANLIENSVKYTPDCGVIVLSAHGNGNEVIISVADNGRGIPAEDMPVLFDKFHRGKPAPPSAAVHNGETDADFLEDADMSGVGLGLYLARNVMEQMGGRISVASDVGRGSVFSLHLPLWRDGGCKESIKNGSDKTTFGR
jgi:signal transduction histidine kinase/type II secretory pathway component PulM